ncbi:MAG: pirin family protein [Thiobacillus sp.]|nr:pirin family protein [Thiobacillus sp.]
MLTVRKSSERGHAHHGWLDSFHTFSFSNYRDPNWMGFGPLRVINDDRIAPGAGFPTHSHQDMEIVTWVLAGALEHKDSLGNGGVIRPGELEPGYEQIAFAPESLQGRLRLIASNDGRDGSVTIHQDAAIHAGRLAAGDRVTLEVAPGRRVWLHIATGRVKVRGYPLEAGDAVAIRFESGIEVEALEPSELIVFDLP